MKAVTIPGRYVFKVLQSAPFLKALKGGMLEPLQSPGHWASSTVSAPGGLLCDEAVLVVPPILSGLSRLPEWDY